MILAVAIYVFIELVLRHARSNATRRCTCDRHVTLICRSSSMMSPAEMTDHAWPAERRMIERSRANIRSGFGRIIIGASVDPVDRSATCACGQNQHRHMTVRRAPSA